MSYAEVMQSYDAHIKDKVYSNTWGHLYMKERKKYKGVLVFVISDYNSGTPSIVRSDFKGLPDSPWFYSDMENFIFKFSHKDKPSGVYVFKGTYCRYKNQNCSFQGKTKRVPYNKLRQ